MLFTNGFTQRPIGEQLHTMKMCALSNKAKEAMAKEKRRQKDSETLMGNALLQAVREIMNPPFSKRRNRVQSKRGVGRYSSR